MSNTLTSPSHASIMGCLSCLNCGDEPNKDSSKLHFKHLKTIVMVLIGRLTKVAVVQLKDERKVVNFTLAVNDYNKPN